MRLLGRADGIVHTFQQESETNTTGEPENEGEAQVPGNIRLSRTGRCACDIHLPDIVGAKTGRHPGFFQLLQQAFVQRAVGFKVALEKAVLDGAFV